MRFSLHLFILLSPLVFLLGCNEDSYVDPVQLTAIRGQVRYGNTLQPVPGATVKLTPGSRFVTTDSLGNFGFDSVIVGKYTIQVSKTSFGTEVATVETVRGTTPVVTVLLMNDAAQNRPPTAPQLVTPAANSVVSAGSLTLRWSSTDPNRDTLTYDVLLFQAGSPTPTLSYTALRVDTLVLPQLAFNTTYLWQIVVKDGVNTVNGAVWSFRTQGPPEYSYLFARRQNGQFQIFGANADGVADQLTREGSNWRPMVSPDKRQVAFISNVSTELQLFVMNLDGSGRQQVTTVPIAGLSATDLSFCWSPDGTELLYPSNDRLYAVRLNGTGLRLVAQARSGRIWAGCDWTPQGNRIVARSTGTRIYDNEFSVFSADGSNAQVIYSRNNGRAGNPVFSVTGQQLLFSADFSDFQNEQGRQLDARLFLLEVGSRAIKDLSSEQNANGTSTQSKKAAGTNDLEPSFSPTDAQIIFTNTDNTGTGNRTLYIADRDGSNRKLLLEKAEMPCWR